MFLEKSPLNNHKDQGKQAEEEGIFFGFGNDLAIDDHPHRAVGVRRKPRTIWGAHFIIEGSRMEVADGFVQNARTYPSGRIPGGIGQIAPRDANPKLIWAIIRIQVKMGNGSVAASDGDCGRVGGAGEKSDVGFATAWNSGSHRSDVFGVGAGKQRRKRGDDVVDLVWVIDVEKVAAIMGGRKFPRIPNSGTIRIRSARSDGTGILRSGAAGENPEGLVGGAVLAGIDVDVKLGLALFQRGQSKQGRGYENAKGQRLTVQGCGGGGDLVTLYFHDSQ